MPLADTIAARITEVANAAEAGGTPESAVETGADTGAAASSAETTIAGRSAADSGVQLTPEQQELEKAAEAKRAVIEAKLAEARDRRAAATQGKRARAEREAAAADRKAAAEERAKLESLKQGTFKQTIEAMGRDPRQVFEEMQREAVEANTPEAEMRRMRVDFERQMDEKIAPLHKTIEQLQSERAALAVQAHAGQIESAFNAEVQGPEYIGLRTEYDDAGLLDYVRHFDENPKAFYAAAKQYGVRLTAPERGFTMREILTVLKSAQDAHEQGRQQRAAKLAPPAAPSAKTPTVNGTAPRGNAGETIGNDLAGERASSGRRLTRRERVEAEIERLEKR